MEYKATNAKSKNSHNKDELRKKKRKSRNNHLHKKEKSKKLFEEKKEKEKYIRYERVYSKYFMKNIMQNTYLYKIKDFIIDWYLQQNISEYKFWQFLSKNTNSMFIFLDRKHYRIVNEKSYLLNMLANENSGIISELLFEELLKNIPNCLSTWEYICSNGNKNVITMIEKNIEKYRCNYGLYYKNFYKSLCMNPHATDIIKKYYDEMFCKECLRNLCRNTNPEALSLIEPFIKDIDVDYSNSENRIYSFFYQCYSNLMDNPSAMPYIKSFKNILAPLLCTNSSAIHIIDSIFNRYGDKLHDEFILENNETFHNWPPLINMKYLCLNDNAIHLLEKNVERINFINLARNENAMDLLEKNLELAKKNNFLDNFESSFWNKKNIKDDNSTYHMTYHNLAIFKANLSGNSKSIELLERHPEFLDEEILGNPNIFEINWNYLKLKFDYVTHEEENEINRYLSKEIENLNSDLLHKVNKDYVTQTELEEIINIYKKRDKYLSEHELVLQLTTERLIKAVYNPSRVSRYLLLYNYDICQDIYCEDDY